MKNEAMKINRLFILVSVFFGLSLMNLHGAAARNYSKPGHRRTYDEQLDYNRQRCKELQRAFSATKEDKDGEIIVRCNVGRLPFHVRLLVREYAGFDNKFIAKIVVPRMLKSEKNNILLTDVPVDSKISVISKYIIEKYNLPYYEEECQQVLEGHANKNFCLCKDRKGDLCTGSFDGLITVSKKKLKSHDGAVTSLCLDVEGNLCSGSGDRTICIWNTVTGEYRQILTGHANSVIDLYVDADGNLCSGDSDDKIRVWSLTEKYIQYWNSLDQDKFKLLQQLFFEYDVHIDEVMIELNENDWMPQQPDWLQEVIQKRLDSIKSKKII